MTNPANSYAMFRSITWDNQGRGSALREYSKSLAYEEWDCILQPKTAQYYKDTWYCKDFGSAKKLAVKIFEYTDVCYIKICDKDVHVDYISTGDDTYLLPGQITGKTRQTG